MIKPRDGLRASGRWVVLAAAFVVTTLPLFAQGAVSISGAGAAPSARRVMLPPEDKRVRGAEAQSTAASRAARAEEPLKALPALTLQDTSGAPVRAESLQPKRTHEHWLLVYTATRCSGCDRVLAALAASTSTTLHEHGRVAVVVRPHQPSEASTAVQQARAAAGNLTNATWSADPDGSALTALKMSSAPAILLLEGTHVHAILHGTLGDPAHVAALAAAWIEHEPAATGSDAAASAQPAVVSVDAALTARSH